MLPNQPVLSLPSTSVAHSLGAFKVNSTKPPSIDQARLARRAEEHFTFVEDVVRRVYDFARTSARHLSNVYGHEEDYYMRLIFHRGAVLHPMPVQQSSSSCQLTRCESALRQRNVPSHIFSR